MKKAFVVVYLITLAFLLGAATYNAGIVQVRGLSMLPTYKDGESALMCRTKEAKKGDVIVFERDGEYNIKRVMAVAGETVDIRDGNLFVDGQKAIVPGDGRIVAQTQSMPHTVSDESFFVLGDNRTVSLDSRYEEVGDIPVQSIIGVVNSRIIYLRVAVTFRICLVCADVVTKFILAKEE